MEQPRPASLHGVRAFCVMEHRLVSTDDRSEFMSECISKEMAAGFDQEQAIAICASKWERGDDDNPTPPQGVREAA